MGDVQTCTQRWPYHDSAWPGTSISAITLIPIQINRTVRMRSWKFNTWEECYYWYYTSRPCIASRDEISRRQGTQNSH